MLLISLIFPVINADCATPFNLIGLALPLRKLPLLYSTDTVVESVTLVITMALAPLVV